MEERIRMPFNKPVAAEMVNDTTMIKAMQAVRMLLLEMPLSFWTPPDRLNIPAPNDADIPATNANRQMLSKEIDHHLLPLFLVSGKSMVLKE